MQTSLQLPIFKDYFSLPESRTNKYDTMGVLHLSDEQTRLRQQIEGWAKVLHERFPIGETCLIDRFGQEHMRLVYGNVERPHNFSNAEMGSIFYGATFKQNKGEVYFSAPYMSPDALTWVTAFTSPIVFNDGTKPGFFHFEVPLSIYQDIIQTTDYGFSKATQKTIDLNEEGRFFIVNKDGLLIADSRGNSDLAIKDEKNPDLKEDLPDYTPPEELHDYLPNVTTISTHPQFLTFVKKMQNGEAGTAHLIIDQRSYVMVYAPVPDRPWGVAHLDPVGGPGFWEKDKP